MPESRTDAFSVVTDDVLSQAILNAKTRLVVVVPALSTQLGQSVTQQWRTLGPERVTVVLDSDPEVYRLGYGDIQALEALDEVARELGATLRRQPGVRIGVVIADHDTIVFVPNAELVEAGPNTRGGANAIRLSRPPSAVEADLGLAPGLKARIGMTDLKTTTVADVKSNLQANPPQRFDLARKMRVFNAFIEFVDLTVRGTALSKRTVTIPSYLLAVANKKTRQQLQAKFQLLSPDDKLSGKELDDYRRRVTGPYLYSIPLFGTVVLRRQKALLQEAVATLSAEVQKFSDAVRAGIQQKIDRNIDELVQSFRGSLSRRPPREWYRPSGDRPDQREVENLLRRDLGAAFGSANQLVGEMKVQCMFKGVTYEVLNDPAFQKAASKVLPDFESFHREFDAVEGVDNQSSSTHPTRQAGIFD